MFDDDDFDAPLADLDPETVAAFDGAAAEAFADRKARLTRVLVDGETGVLYESLALFVVCGLMGGAMMPIFGALIGRLFGAEAFGQVMGLAALVGLPVLAAAPVLFGVVGGPGALSRSSPCSAP